MCSALPPASLDERDDVRQRLARLRDKILAVEFLLGIPADLAGEKNHAAFGGDAVGKALRLFSSFADEEMRAAVVIGRASFMTRSAAGGSAGFFRSGFSAARR